MKFVAIDTETTGLDPTAHGVQVIELAMIHAEVLPGREMTILDKFHALVGPRNNVEYEGELYALKMNRSIIQDAMDWLKLGPGKVIAEHKLAEVIKDCIDL